MEVPDSPRISRKNGDADARLASQTCTIEPRGRRRLRRCTTDRRRDRRGARAGAALRGAASEARSGPRRPRPPALDTPLPLGRCGLHWHVPRRLR